MTLPFFVSASGGSLSAGLLRRPWSVCIRAKRASPCTATFSRPLYPPSDPERTPLLPPHGAEPDPDTEIDRAIEKLLALKAREALEDVFGLLLRILAFVPCLQCINSLLLSIGLFFLLGALLYSADRWGLVALAAATHLLHAVLHAPWVLPRVGVHGAAFVGAVVSISALFAGLGRTEDGAHLVLPALVPVLKLQRDAALREYQALLSARIGRRVLRASRTLAT
ncbi:hypothetical protein FB451DRAFT_1564421 [Mycena latifolia]|nr:hypothetical protein FB451DRAFT_1564421 [Mycena latifolia]